MLDTTLVADASESLIERTRDDWLVRYCINRVGQVAVVPTEFDRSRGPLISLSPVLEPGRYEGRDSATCTFDYYIHPVAREAFEKLDVEYAANVSGFGSFAGELTKRVRNILVSEGWEEFEGEGDDEGVEADLMMVRRIEEEQVSEYVDVFVTRDEEVVFELLVVDEIRRFE